jgi:hypothetical protein
MVAFSSPSRPWLRCGGAPPSMGGRGARLPPPSSARCGPGVVSSPTTRVPGAAGLSGERRRLPKKSGRKKAAVGDKDEVWGPCRHVTRPERGRPSGRPFTSITVNFLHMCRSIILSFCLQKVVSGPISFFHFIKYTHTRMCVCVSV